MSEAEANKVRALEDEIGVLGDKIANLSAEIFDAFNYWCVAGEPRAVNEEVVTLLTSIVKSKSEAVAQFFTQAVLARRYIDFLGAGHG